MFLKTSKTNRWSVFWFEFDKDCPRCERRLLACNKREEKQAQMMPIEARMKKYHGTKNLIQYLGLILWRCLWVLVRRACAIYSR